MFFQFFYFPILIISALIYWTLPNQKWRIAFLSLTSLALIYFMDKTALVIVLGLTVFTYCIANRMEEAENKKLHLIVGIAGTVSLLLLFRYTLFSSKIIYSLQHLFSPQSKYNFQNLIMPLGISYIVFKHISYLVDVYRGTVTKGSFLDFVCYGSLFTIFGAGPIERFAKLKPQLEAIQTKFQTVYFNEAFIRISIGLFKKLVIADWLGFFVSPIWKNPNTHHPLIISLTIIGYGLRLYFDFSGYSDISIGSSRLFGLKIMENFDNPYLAKNIGDFWRRWHISLSNWIRDYLFLPLSKLSYIRAWMIYLAPPIAMTICGLWHGSQLHFLAWGFCQGVAIDVFQYFRKTKSRFIKTLRNSSLFTFTFVIFAWVIFNYVPSLKSNLLNPVQYLIIVVSIPLILYPIQKILGFVSGLKLFYNTRNALVLLIIALAMQCLVNTNFIYMNF